MVVGSDFQALKSVSTVVSEGFWIPMNTESNRFAYIYTKLEISTPFNSDLHPHPQHKTHVHFNFLSSNHLYFYYHPGQIFKLLALPRLPSGRLDFAGELIDG